MCGRYAASKDQAELVEELDIELDATGEPSRSILANPQHPPAGTPDWNMAPTKQAPVVLTRAPRTSETPTSETPTSETPTSETPTPETRAPAAEPAAAVRQLRLVTWGLVPSWSKDTRTGLRMINARAESVLDKPGFAKAAASRRCLVPADGWYEWQVSPTATDAKGKPRKQPFFMHRADGDLVTMAGLYEFWRDRSVDDADEPDAWLTTFTIITTSAEPGLDRVHDRQPLVLEREHWDRWLDPQLRDVDEVRDLLAFSSPGRFEAYPVSSAVSATRNNGAELLEPLPRDELRGVVDPVTGEVVGE